MYRQAIDADVHARLDDLIKECLRIPIQGTDMPEPLQGELKGWWSRHVTIGGPIE